MGLHDRFNWSRFLFEAFFQPIFFLFHFESFLITFVWREMGLNRTPAPIELK